MEIFYQLFKDQEDKFDSKYESRPDNLKQTNQQITELELLVKKYEKTKNPDVFKSFMQDASGKENEPRDSDQSTTSTRTTRARATNAKKVLKEIKSEPPTEEPEPPIEEPEPKLMPAPFKVPALKAKKIKTEKLAKQQPPRMTRSQRRIDSDVIIQKPNISVVEILSDEEENEPEPKPVKAKATRSTRTKTRAKAEMTIKLEQLEEQISKPAKPATRNTRVKAKAAAEMQIKRSRSQSGGDSSNAPKKSKSSSPNTTAKTVYEDALEQPEPNETYVTKAATPKTNETFVATKGPPNETYIATTVPSNETFVAVSNETYVAKPNDVLNNGVITDDESFEVKHTKTKQIFSPFDKTPLKKKVEAFEKFGKKNMQSKIAVKTTPVAKTGVVAAKLSSAAKVSNAARLRSDSESSAQKNSALKASAAEFRERLKRQKEKEVETLKKREALLQLQSEEKRKKREEKHLKAQQVRELKEKEKVKQIELLQQKEEERKRQLLKEKRELRAKQLEEVEMRRMLAKKKAAAEAKKATAAAAATNQLPLYLTVKTPLLPCDDCYDSDDEEYGKVHHRTPAWASSGELKNASMAQMLVTQEVLNSFFSRQEHVVDLVEIFQTTDQRKLKRTSSACWKTSPARFTMIPNLEEYSIIEEDADADED